MSRNTMMPFHLHSMEPYQKRLQHHHCRGESFTKPEHYKKCYLIQNSEGVWFNREYIRDTDIRKIYVDYTDVDPRTPAEKAHAFITNRKRNIN